MSETAANIIPRRVNGPWYASIDVRGYVCPHGHTVVWEGRTGMWFCPTCADPKDEALELLRTAVTLVDEERHNDAWRTRTLELLGDKP